MALQSATENTLPNTPDVTNRPIQQNTTITLASSSAVAMRIAASASRLLAFSLWAVFEEFVVLQLAACWDL